MEIGQLTATILLNDQFTSKLDKASTAFGTYATQVRTLSARLSESITGQKLDQQYGKYAAAAKEYLGQIKLLSNAAADGSTSQKSIAAAAKLASENFALAKQRIDEQTASQGKNADSGYTVTRMLERLAIRVTVLAAAYKSLQAVKDSVAEAIDVTRKLGQIEAVTNAGAAGVKNLKDSFASLAEVSGRGPKELSNAYYLIASASQNSSNNIKILTASAKASAVGLGDTADIAKTITAVINAYGESNITASKAADVLFETVRQGGAEASEIAPVLGRVAALASQMGVSFDQVGTFVATFTRLGVGADEAVTALRGTLNSMITPTKKQEEALHAVGMSMASLRQEVREKGLTAAMVDLMRASKGNEDIIGAIIPNVRALSGALSVYAAQGEEVVKIQDAISNSGGALEKGLAVTGKSGVLSIDQIRARWELFLNDMGQRILPAIEKVGTELTKMIRPEVAAEFGKLISDLVTGIGALLSVLVSVLKHVDALETVIAAVIALKMYEWLVQAANGFVIWAEKALGAEVATAGLAAEAETAAAASGPFGLLVTVMAGAAVLVGNKMEALKKQWASDIDDMVAKTQAAGVVFDRFRRGGSFTGTDTGISQARQQLGDSQTNIAALKEKLALQRQDLAQQEAIAKAAGISHSEGVAGLKDEILNTERQIYTEKQHVNTANAVLQSYYENKNALNQVSLATRSLTDIFGDNTEAAKKNDGAYKPLTEAQQNYASRVAETTSQLIANAAAARATFAAAQAQAAARHGGGGTSTDEEAVARQMEIEQRLQRMINENQNRTNVLTKETINHWRELITEQVTFEAGTRATKLFWDDLLSMEKQAGKALGEFSHTFIEIAKHNREWLEAQASVSIDLLHARTHLEAMTDDLDRIAAGGKKAAYAAQIEAEWRARGVKYTQEQVSAAAELAVQTDHVAKLIQLAVENSKDSWEIWLDAGMSAIDNISTALHDVLVSELEKGSVDGAAIWKSFADSMIETFVGAIIEMVKQTLVKWLVMEQTKTAITAAEAAKRAAIEQAAGASGGGGGTSSTGGVSPGTVANTGGRFGTSGNAFYTGGGSSGITSAGWAGIYAAIVLAFLNYVKTRGTPKITGSINIGGEGGISANLSDASHGQLRRLQGMDKLMQELVKRVQDFVHGIGGMIAPTEEAAKLLVRKIGQGKKTDWVVVANGVAEHFGKEMDAALDYAMVQAIKMVNTVGVSPEIKTAMHNTAARTMDELQADIQVATDVLNARLGDVGGQILQIYNKYKAEIEKAQALGLATDGLVQARDREINAIKNNILGIDTSTSDALAALLSFQNGMDELSRNIADAANNIPTNGRPPRDPGGIPHPGEGDYMPGGGGGGGLRNDLAPGLPAGFDYKLTESVQHITDVIQKMMDDLAKQGVVGDAATQKVRAALQAYFANLAKAPQKLTDSEVNMAIFDQLYKYLEGSKKYAKQAHEYARLKVEMEFATIKAQLIALGKWEEFASMFNDAYRAALAALDKPPKSGGGGGTDKPDASGISDIIDQLLGYLKNTKDFEALREKYAKLRVIAEFQTMKMQLMAAGVWKDVEALWNAAYAAALAAAGKPVKGDGSGGGGKNAPHTKEEIKQFIADAQYARAQAMESNLLQRTINDINKKYKEEEKGLKHNSAEYRNLEHERQADIDLATQQYQADTQAKYDDLVGNTNAFTKLHQQFDDMRTSVNNAGYGAEKTAEMLARLTTAETEAAHTLGQETLASLYEGIAKYMTDGAEKEKFLYNAANIRYQLDKMNMLAQIQILRSQAELLGIAVADLDALDQSIRNMPTNLPPLKYDGKQLFADDFATRGADGQPANTDAADKLKAAKELLQKYIDEGLNKWQKALKDLNADFDTIRASLGNTPEVMHAYADALARLRTEFLQGLRDFRDELARGEISGATVSQQFTNAATKYQQLATAVRGGDLSQADALRAAAEAYRNLAAQMFGTSTGGFASVREQILRDLSSILDDTATSNVIGGPSYFIKATNDTISAINTSSADVASSVDRLNDHMVDIESKLDALTAIRDNTANTVTAIRDLEPTGTGPTFGG